MQSVVEFRDTSFRPMVTEAVSDRVRACPMCGGLDARRLLDSETRSTHGEPYHVVACARCDLRYTRPLPTLSELSDVYSDGYIIYHSVSKENAARRKGLLSVDAFASLYMRTLFWDRRRALLNRPPGRILDVGCGTGDFLVSLKQRGWEVHGTEFSSRACEMARARGIDVHQADLASVRFPKKFFDTVTLWHVLEHLEDPLATLTEARRILKDDGLLIVEVPNSACLTFRLCQEKWFLLEVPQHVQHFTPATLKQMLERSGFNQVYRQNIRCWNFHIDFYSFLNALRIRERLNIRYFSTDFGRADLGSKALFALLGLPLAFFCLPYSILTTLLTGNGQILTVTARKTGLANEEPIPASAVSGTRGAA